MNKCPLILLTGIIANFLISTNSAAAEPDKEHKIKFAAMLHLTGEFAIQGEAFRRGAELAMESANKSGGINGSKLEVIFEDTQYKPLQSNTAAKKLAAAKDISGVIISTLTEAKAAANVLEKNKLPSIVLWDSSPELDQMGDYIFSIGPWAPASGEKSAQFALDNLNAKTAVIINVQTEWSVYVSKYFEEKFKAGGGTILNKFSLDPNDQDFRTVILKTKSLSPSVIYAPIDSNILAFFKQFHSYGIKIPLITSDILDKELFDAGGDIFNGIYQSQSSNPEFAQTSQMIAEYKQKYNEAPDYLMYTAWAYDGIKVLAEAVKTAGTDRSKIKDEIYKIQDIQGASGVISFNKSGSAPREVKIYIVNKGSLSPAM